ncbi:aldehyde dehydrogenase family protein, partial [Salmonella enterica subsp. enterica]
PYKTEFGDAWVEHHPIGVIMAVEPWNFPYYQLIRVLAPNLAAVATGQLLPQIVAAGDGHHGVVADIVFGIAHL